MNHHKPNRSLTTTLMLFAVGVSLLFLLDPANQDWGGSAVREIKFAPVAAMFSAAVLLLIRRVKWSVYFVLLLSFALLMLAGSLYSVILLDSELEETYLSRGLIASSALLAGFLIAQRPASLSYLVPRVQSMLLIYAWGVAGLVILFRLGVAFCELVQIYQVQSGLVAVAMMLTINRMTGRVRDKLSLVVFAISLLLIAKTSALLMLTLALAAHGYVYFAWYLARGAHGRLIKWAGLVAIVASVLIAFALLYQARLDDRGNDTRESNMQIRIDQFMESPIAGNLFTGSPLVDFGPLHIPSHSEWLDMFAAAGGLAAIMLVLPITWLILKSALLEVSSQGLRLRQWLSLVVIAYATLMTVNPILFMPSLALPFWLVLGLLAGLHATGTDYFFRNKKLYPVRKTAILR